MTDNSEIPVNSETRIYRFFDFFALASTIKNRRLRFSSASTFQDRNEGLEILYNSLRAAVESNDGSYSGFVSKKDILHFHSALKSSHFVCSWTREADSIALWSLYSLDRYGVRISSTVSKLQTAIDDFACKNGLQSQFERYGLNDPSPYAFVNGAAVSQVCYENLRKMHEDILKREHVGAQRVLRDIEEKKQNFEFFTLKDEAYKHEGEIRGVVICSLASPSGSTGSFTESAPWLDGDYMYVDIPGDFVESVAIDPRCPRYKREIIEEYLRDQNISLDTSRAFGYLPDELDFVTPKTETPTSK